MNVNKLEELAELLRKQPHFKDLIGALLPITHAKWETIPDAFNLGTIHSGNGCQSVGCIIGYGLGIEGYQPNTDFFYATPFEEFSERFGLPYSVTAELCNPRGTVKNYAKITPQDAAQAVENVINGATIDKEIWKHTIK